MKTEKEIYENVKRKAQVYEKNKKRKTAMFFSAVAVCLVVALTLGIVLPMTTAGGNDGGGIVNEPLTTYTSKITVKVNNSVGGYDGTVWDQTNSLFTYQAEYDVNLDAYPSSITRYLANQMELSKSEEKYYWVKIDVVGLSTSYEDNKDIFTSILDRMEAPYERTALKYYVDGYTGEQYYVSGALALWTRAEILALAERYERLYPTHRLESGNYAGVAISMDVNHYDPYSEILDFDMYGAYQAADDEDYFFAEIEYSIAVEEYVLSYISWDNLVKTAKEFSDKIPDSDLTSNSYGECFLSVSAEILEQRKAINSATYAKGEVYKTGYIDNRDLFGLDFMSGGGKLYINSIGDYDVTAINYSKWRRFEYAAYDGIDKNALYRVEKPATVAATVKNDIITNISKMAASNSHSELISAGLSDYELSFTVRCVAVLTKAQLTALMLDSEINSNISINVPSFGYDKYDSNVYDSCQSTKDNWEKEHWSEYQNIQ